MQWWVLELITIGVLVAALAVLGPLIKRFGRSYAADVFRANPRTGKSYIVLMDFALLPHLQRLHHVHHSVRATGGVGGHHKCHSTPERNNSVGRHAADHGHPARCQCAVTAHRRATVGAGAPHGCRRRGAGHDGGLMTSLSIPRRRSGAGS